MSEFSDRANEAVRSAGLDPNRPFSDDPENFLAALDVIEAELLKDMTEVERAEYAALED